MPSSNLNYMKRKLLTSHLEITPLKETSPYAKLAWLYIAEHGENAYTVRDLTKALTIGSTRSARLALDDLCERGLLVKTEQGVGGRPTRYKANYPDGENAVSAERES